MDDPDNASFMMHALFDRQREIGGPDKVDPFFLLREVAEMSNIQNLAKKEEEMTAKELESRQNYNNMVMKNYQPPVVLDIEERMKKLKFAKKENVPSQSDWFSRFQEQQKDQPIVPTEKKELKFGITKADELQIQKEMIPTYIAKQNELKPQYEHIQNVGKELQQIKEEFGVVIKQAKPQATTGFMTRRGSQAKQYELITNQIRNNRLQKQQDRMSQMPAKRSTSRTSRCISPALPVKQNIMFLKNEDKVSEKDSERSVDLKSEISDFQKKDDDDRICKKCGFFGCDQKCKTQKQEKKVEEIVDKGQSFIPNEYGLIDREKTEKLFLNRKQMPSPSLLKEEEYEGCKTTTQTTQFEDIQKPQVLKRVVSTAKEFEGGGLRAKKSKDFIVKMHGASRFSVPKIEKLLEDKKKYVLNPLSPSQKMLNLTQSSFSKKMDPIKEFYPSTSHVKRRAPLELKHADKRYVANILKINDNSQSVGPISPAANKSPTKQCDFFSAQLSQRQKSQKDVKNNNKLYNSINNILKYPKKVKLSRSPPKKGLSFMSNHEIKANKLQFSEIDKKKKKKLPAFQIYSDLQEQSITSKKKRVRSNIRQRIEENHNKIVKWPPSQNSAVISAMISPVQNNQRNTPFLKTVGENPYDIDQRSPSPKASAEKKYIVNTFSINSDEKSPKTPKNLIYLGGAPPKIHSRNEKSVSSNVTNKKALKSFIEDNVGIDHLKNQKKMLKQKLKQKKAQEKLLKDSIQAEKRSGSRLQKKNQYVLVEIRDKSQAFPTMRSSLQQLGLYDININGEIRQLRKRGSQVAKKLDPWQFQQTK